MPSRFLLAFQLMLTVPVFGQMQRNDDIFPRAGNYERRGWTVSPMLTYTLPAFKQYSERLFLGNDSVYDISFQGKGRVSFGIEIGRFQAIDASRIISFVDLNIGAKILRGVEETEAVLAERGAIRTNTLRQQSVFDRHMLTLSFNATNVKSLGKHIFMRNTLGINGEYDFLPVYHTSGAPLAIEQHYPGRFLFQTHYKFGIGFHLNNRVIMLPSIETPILSIYEFDDFKSSMLIFNSRYRPVLFKVQFLVLDKRPNRKCPSKGTNRRSRESLFGMIDGKRPW